MKQAPDSHEPAPPWSLDILLVEGDDDARDEVTEILAPVGHRVRAVRDEAEALAAARVRAFDILIVDARSRSTDGFALMSRLRALSPRLHVILTAGTPAIDDAVAATAARADYLAKPLASRELLASVARVARRRELHAELASPRAETMLVGRSPLIVNLRKSAHVVAKTDGVVLVCGEPGTGKGRLVAMIHEASPRSAGPMIELDCTAGDPDRQVDELFGRDGWVEQARGGTVVLDRVEALTGRAQARLMSYLEGDGASAASGESARVVGVTTADLDHLVARHAFRADLACRLKEFRLWVPPLRKRRDDLPLLAEYFCLAHAPDEDVPRFAPEVWAILAAQKFPGNVRELELVIKHALAFCDGGHVRVEHLPPEMRAQWSGVSPPTVGVRPLGEAVRAFEHQYLRQALEETNGNRTRAASLLGISRKSLWAKLKRHQKSDIATTG